MNRDTCLEFAYNSRLDTIQAVVAKHVIENKLKNITDKRIHNSHLFDSSLSEISNLKIPKRDSKIKEVFHLYMFSADKRAELVDYLRQNNVDAKVHYPIPMHLQPAAKNLGYKKGDFPVAEKLALESISLPVHEFINDDDIEYTSNLIKKFYS